MPLINFSKNDKLYDDRDKIQQERFTKNIRETAY